MNDPNNVEKDGQSRFDPFISKPWFFGTSFAIVSVGMFAGVHHVLKAEQIKVDIRSVANRGPFVVATKALIGGTCLCFGTFIGCTALFIGATGITSLSEFGQIMRSSFSKVEVLQNKSELAITDKEKTKGMTESQELDYLGWKYFTDIHNPLSSKDKKE